MKRTKKKTGLNASHTFSLAAKWRQVQHKQMAGACRPSPSRHFLLSVRRAWNCTWGGQSNGTSWSIRSAIAYGNYSYNNNNNNLCNCRTNRSANAACHSVVFRLLFLLLLHSTLVKLTGINFSWENYSKIPKKKDNAKQTGKCRRRNERKRMKSKRKSQGNTKKLRKKKRKVLSSSVPEIAASADSARDSPLFTVIAAQWCSDNWNYRQLGWNFITSRAIILSYVCLIKLLRFSWNLFSMLGYIFFYIYPEFSLDSGKLVKT